MRAIGPISMYTLVFLVLTTSRAEGDLRDNQNNVRHVQQITGLVITRAIPYTIPQPYQVTVEQEVPYGAVKVPVEVPVERPFQVDIPKPFTVPVYRPVPYPVHRIVPYPVQVLTKSNDDRPTTSRIPDFQQKPLDGSNHLEYDVATPFTRHVPVRSIQPVQPPQPTSFPAISTTSESTPFNLNFVDAVRFPLKPSDPLPAISFQSQRQFSGFNVAAPQSNEHQQPFGASPADQQQPFGTSPAAGQSQQQQPFEASPAAGQSQQQQSFGAGPANQGQQQPSVKPSVLIRRPLTFGAHSAMLATFHQQPNSDPERLNGIDYSTSGSDELNHDLLANIAQGAVFNLSNRLRRQSADTVTAKTSTTPKPKKV